MDAINFTAIDFETANSKRSSACSIGMAKVRNGVVVEHFYRLLRPVTGDFQPINISIHGITPDQVESCPTLVEAWDEIEAFIGGDVLVAHNVSFEQSVINQSFAAEGLRLPNLDYLCTLYMTRLNHPNRQGYRLPDVCKDLLGYPVNHHNALEDAIACAELGILNISKFREQSPRSLIEVLYTTPVRQKQDWKKEKGYKPSKEELDPSHPFYLKTVVVTGELRSMSKERAATALVNCGAVWSETVTKKTEFLILGDQQIQMQKYGKPSNKLLKAREYNSTGASIEILEEEMFLVMVEAGVDELV